MNKYFLTIIFSLLLVSTISATEINIITSNQNISIGEEFIINIYGNLTETGAYEVMYYFDKELLEPVSIQIPKLNDYFSGFSREYNTALGFDALAIPYNQENLYSGYGLMGTLTLRAIKGGQTNITPAFENQQTTDSNNQTIILQQPHLFYGINNQKELLNLETFEINIDETSYIPIDDEVLEIVEKIKGLENGTILNISIEENQTSKPSDTKVFKYLNITSNQETTAELIFKLNQSEVSDKNKISLYVLENNDWTKLSTELINESGEFYTYQSNIPHFSLFLIAEDIYVAPTPTPSTSSGSSSNHGGSSKYVKPKVIPKNETTQPEENKTGAEINLDNNKGITGKTILQTTKENYKIILLIISSLLLILLVIKLKKQKQDDKQ